MTAIDCPPSSAGAGRSVRKTPRELQIITTSQRTMEDSRKNTRAPGPSSKSRGCLALSSGRGLVLLCPGGKALRCKSLYMSILANLTVTRKNASKPAILRHLCCQNVPKRAISRPLNLAILLY